MDLLTEFLKRNRQKRLSVHVAGDVMLDLYYEVSVQRICPEAPVPVLLSTKDKPVTRLGGASNVAHQFRHFNADVKLVCFQNDEFDAVRSQYSIDSISPSITNFQIPIKKRFLDKGIQIVRHDIEAPTYGISQETIEFATKQIIDRLSEPEIAILSDYDKGFFYSEASILHFYKSRNIKTIVDPKNGPLSKWKGCTVCKPNAAEAEKLTGKKTWKEQAKHIQNELECEAVVITHSNDRVAGVWKDEFFCYTPTKEVKVMSVVGAGDTFSAFFAMALGHGFTVPEAAEIAWNAGAIYVQGSMNCPIIPAELSNGIVEPEDLANRDFRLVMANGAFDIIHTQHIELLKFAKSKGHKLVVALNSDDSIKRLKGDNRPIVPLEHRLSVMSSLKFVDFVVVFEEDTPLEIIKKMKPDAIVKGGDYELNQVVGFSEGIDIHLFPYKHGVSTTNLISRI